MLLSYRDRKRPPFSDEALAMYRNAFPLFDSFLCHQTKGNDERVYLAGYFRVGSRILIIHEKTHLISGLGVADAIAVCLSSIGLHVQLVEVRKVFRLHSVFSINGCRNP